MHLSITNNTQEPEAIGSPSGSFVDALTPGTPFNLDSDEDVLVIGDKPEVREQFAQAAGVLTGVVKHLLAIIAGRRAQLQAGGAAAGEELVDVTILNRGEAAVRVLLGDGTDDIEIEPGESTQAKAVGYLELRELGHAPQQGGTPE